MTTVTDRPPLVRSSDRIIAGVCAGLADHLGWPVRYIRWGIVLASLAGGAGAVFYAWLWIMVPTADERARREARRPASPIAPAVSLRSEGTANAAHAAPFSGTQSPTAQFPGQQFAAPQSPGMPPTGARFDAGPRTPPSGTPGWGV